MGKMEKPKRFLKFVGQRGPDGKPVEFVGWAPARDLTEEDLALIGDEKIEDLLASRLYVWSNGSTPAPSGISLDEEKGEE